MAMAVDKIKVSGDPRVEHRSAFVNGKTYGTRAHFYILYRRRAMFLEIHSPVFNQVIHLKAKLLLEEVIG